MHKAKACVINCIDFRFQKYAQKFLDENGYLGCCDEIVIAGFSRDFIKPMEENDGRYAWKQLELSLKLHNPDEIIFIDHQDCGGYAQDNTIKGGQEKEKDIIDHSKYLKMVKEKVMNKYNKTILFFYIDLNGKVEKLKI